MILELQIKYLREMEKVVCTFYIIDFPHFCLCQAARKIGGNDFKDIIRKEGRQYCEQKNIEIPFNDKIHWFPLDKEGLKQRKRIIRAIRKRKEALLQECNY